MGLRKWTMDLHSIELGRAAGSRFRRRSRAQVWTGWVRDVLASKWSC